jgi:two-component system sensor histidine kinase TctE
MKLSTRAGLRRLVPRTLRWQLLAGIVLPIALFLSVDAWITYTRVLSALDTAYDRSLLASARSIGELIEADGDKLRVQVPFAALDIFEADNVGGMFYRIGGLNGEFVSGHADLPVYTRRLPQRSSYAALVDFYDAVYRGEPVRMAALYQPVAGATLRGVALVQVAETREIRERAALAMLVDSMARHVALLLAVAAVVALVVTRALAPLRALRQALERRDANDLSAIDPGDAALPAELRPMPAAINDLMQRLAALISHQRQFVRDASHQLRTPLAVLKTQAQNGLSGHADAQLTLQQMHATIDRAIRLANQMLALAKLEQVAQQEPPQPVDLAEVTREVALDMAPLIAARDIDFELRADDQVTLSGHAWILRELVRNLLHNAVRATPPGAPLLLAVLGSQAGNGTGIGNGVVSGKGNGAADSGPGPAGTSAAMAPTASPPGRASLLVRDSGPGLSPAVQAHLFEAFQSDNRDGGSGLGLAICKQVCERMGARISLVNRLEDGVVVGLDARVDFEPESPADVGGPRQIAAGPA